MSDAAIYEFYDSIIKFCNVTGHFVSNKALLDDVKSGYPSPDSLRVMVDSHGGDVIKLEKKVAKNRIERRGAWAKTMDNSIALDNYDRTDAICFVSKLEQIESVDKFRKNVRSWCSKELEIFKRDGCWTTEKPLSFGEFIMLYQEGKLNHKDWPSRRRKIMSSKKDPVD
jgi:hypothetical protein